MKKTINTLVIALFFTFATAFVQAGGDMHEPGYKCINEPGCPQTQTVTTGGGNSAVTAALVQLVIALVPKG